MTTRDHMSRAWLVLITSALGALLIVALFPSRTAALPPPRKPTPTTPPTVPHGPLAGGAIELRIQFGQTWPWADIPEQDLKTTVQWQDSLGEWHDVEGWRGESFDEVKNNEGRKTWWVSGDHFGSGPFRWVVYQGQGTEPLAASESFYMPSSNGETVRVKGSLDL